MNINIILTVKILPFQGDATLLGRNCDFNIPHDTPTSLAPNKAIIKVLFRDIQGVYSCF